MSIYSKSTLEKVELNELDLENPNDLVTGHLYMSLFLCEKIKEDVSFMDKHSKLVELAWRNIFTLVERIRTRSEIRLPKNFDSAKLENLNARVGYLLLACGRASSQDLCNGLLMMQQAVQNRTLPKSAYEMSAEMLLESAKLFANVIVHSEVEKGLMHYFAGNLIPIRKYIVGY